MPSKATVGSISTPIDNKKRAKPNLGNFVFLSRGTKDLVLANIIPLNRFLELTPHSKKFVTLSDDLEEKTLAHRVAASQMHEL